MVIFFMYCKYCSMLRHFASVCLKSLSCSSNSSNSGRFKILKKFALTNQQNLNLCKKIEKTISCLSVMGKHPLIGFMQGCF